MSYQASSGQYLNYRAMRGMSFMIALKDGQEALPGFFHHLVIPPTGYTIQPVNRSSIQYPYGDPWIEHHISGDVFQVQMQGNCLNTRRVMTDGKVVDGESVLRSLADIFHSAMGKYPAGDNQVFLRGSDSIEGPYYLDDIELRWFNWGFQIESAISQDNNYYKIFPESFNIQWQRGRIVPNYSISFTCYKKLAVTTSMKDEAIKTLTEAKAMQDAATILDSMNRSWIDKMATRYANLMAGVYRTIGDMEIAINRQRTMGSKAPIDYGKIAGFFSDIGDWVSNL